VRLIFRPQRTDAGAPRKAGSLIKEVGLVKFRFSARPLQARLRSRCGGINSPSRVRKGGRYPRAPEAALASAPPAVSEAYAAMESGNATFCAQRYRSYDPASSTVLGHDGRRHRCE
jgi:BA14K-like protein